MERAEREFRMSIGDPYKRHDDPFAWERISRMDVDEADKLLEAELYGQGKFLGGELGEEYGTATTKELESYTSGLRGESEALSHGTLTSGVALGSGTSGATLRSGGNVATSEDILTDVYKKAKTLGTDYRSGVEKAGETLETDMERALTTYITAIEDEKKAWYQIIKDDVARAVSPSFDMDYEFGVEDAEKWGEQYGYSVEAGGDWEMRDQACGIGMLWDGEKCIVAEELNLESDEYGYLCPSGKIDECGVCDGDGSTCQDQCGVPNGDGKSCLDECGVPYGNNDCLDECGVPNGSGKVLCQDGTTMACSYDECPDLDLPGPQNCPPNTTWDGQKCNPMGDMICTEEGEEYDPVTNSCVPIPGWVDPGFGGEFDVLCNEGTSYESWTKGSSPTDYSNCPNPADWACADGSQPNPNTGLCPEDMEEGCECVPMMKWNHKTGRRTYEYKWSCDNANDPRNGTVCSSSDSGEGEASYIAGGSF